MLSVRAVASILAAVVAGLILLPASSQAATITLFADLSPGQEVPPVTNSDAVGSASMIYDDVSNQLTFAILFAGLTGDLTAAHFHDGDAGIVGPVVIDIEPLLPGSMLPTGTSGLMTATVTVDQGLEEDLLNEGLYLNLHTALNEGGEIRGQIQNATTQMPEPVLGLMLLLAGAGFAARRIQRST